jgi:hypothetical protein
MRARNGDPVEELVAFLLARIAEDRVWLQWLESTFGNARRWVADCDVRLQIVRLVAPHPIGVDSLAGCEVLRLMAVAYAAHPDYLPRWQP